MHDFDIFEYAGVNSSVYNLVLCEIDKDYKTAISGAEYEPTVDTLPRSASQLLLGLDYSDKPLEIDLEIINPDENIPYSQVEEIKDWLFGQEGWKKFVLINERQDYYLRALLIPDEDIMDVNGYRGFRCKLRNDSGFWYKDEKIDLPLTFVESTPAEYMTIKKTINLHNIPNRVEISPTVKFATNPPRRIKHSISQLANQGSGRLPISDASGVTPEYVMVFRDKKFNHLSKIAGEFNSTTGMFIPTNSSDISAGTTYYVIYYTEQNTTSSTYWNEDVPFYLRIQNVTNDSIMAFEGNCAEFSAVADCKYGTYQITQDGKENTYNLKYPPFIDSSSKYSNLLYLSRGKNVFKIGMRLNVTNSNAWYINNMSDGVFANNKITFLFTSLHRIGGF